MPFAISALPSDFLSRICNSAACAFSLEYCAIHVLENQRSGNSRCTRDYERTLVMLIEEQQQHVHYLKIYGDDEIIGFLAVKGNHLSRNQLEVIASMLSIFITYLQDSYAIFAPSALN